MGDNTGIEWTDATWNIVTGCSVVSPGCTNCYAMRMAGTRLKETPAYTGLTVQSKAGPVWNGQVRFNEKQLGLPLQWTKPRRVFVNSMGDLFHEGVPREWIDHAFAVMILARQHVFQILTKRPDRMRAYAENIVPVELGRRWPLDNVWLGTSCEDQQRADERIPDLLRTKAAVHWVSAEPLLGPIQFQFGRNNGTHFSALDWVVTGGESGPNARPANPQWFRDIRDQCQDAGVAFLHKQNGEWVSVSEVEGPGDHYTFPDHRSVRRIGKKLAGRTIDGKVYDEYPA